MIGFPSYKTDIFLDILHLDITTTKHNRTENLQDTPQLEIERKAVDDNKKINYDSLHAWDEEDSLIYLMLD